MEIEEKAITGIEDIDKMIVNDEELSQKNFEIPSDEQWFNKQSNEEEEKK